MTFRLTETADADLLNILLAGIDGFGVARAANYRAGLERSFELIGSHPYIGRIRGELPASIRVLAHRSHVILYEVDDAGDAIILRIRHAREDWIADPIDG